MCMNSQVGMDDKANYGLLGAFNAANDGDGRHSARPGRVVPQVILVRLAWNS